MISDFLSSNFINAKTATLGKQLDNNIDVLNILLIDAIKHIEIDAAKESICAAVKYLTDKTIPNGSTLDYGLIYTAVEKLSPIFDECDGQSKLEQGNKFIKYCSNFGGTTYFKDNNISEPIMLTLTSDESKQSYQGQATRSIKDEVKKKIEDKVSSLVAPLKIETLKNELAITSAQELTKITGIKKKINALEAVLISPQASDLDRKYAKSSYCNEVQKNLKLISQWCSISEDQLNDTNSDHYSSLEEVYIEFHCLFTNISQIESSNHAEVPAMALKALLLFTPLHKGSDVRDFKYKSILNLRDFIRTSAGNLERPIHDIFMHEVPLLENPKDAVYWKSVLIRKDHAFGMQGIAALKLANLITEELNKNLPAGFKDIKQLTSVLSNLSYANVPEKYKKFAAECYKYKVPSKQWKKMMKLEQELKFKQEDYLPDVGEITLNNLHMSKLPFNDRTGYILGNIVSCCQHIDGHSEQCAIDGMTLKSNGFYVFKNNQSEIIGTAYAWISETGNLCLDSLEFHPRYINNDKFRNNIKDLINIFVKQLLVKNPNIYRVTIGVGGGTQSVLGLINDQEFISNPETMREGFMYGDAEVQVVIATRSLISPIFRSKHHEDNYIRLWLNYRYQNFKTRKFNLLEFAKFYPISDKFIDQSTILNIEDLTFWNSLKKAHILQDIENGKFAIEDLYNIYINSGDAKYEYLISQNCNQGYNRRYYTITDLEGLEADQIEALSSESAHQGYEKHLYKIADIKGFDLEKIRELTSVSANLGYERRLFDFATLKDWTYAQIGAVTAESAFQGYERKLFTLSDIKDLDYSKVSALTTESAYQGYKEGLYTFEELKKLNGKAIEALTTESANQGYKDGLYTFEELKELNGEVIKTLTTESATQGLKDGLYTINEFKGLNEKAIELLTTASANQGYKDRLYTLEQLKGFNLIIVMALTTESANQGYKDGLYTLEQLKSCGDVNKILALTSNLVNQAYKNGLYTFEQLKDYDLYKICNLTLT